MNKKQIQIDKWYSQRSKYYDELFRKSPWKRIYLHFFQKIISEETLSNGALILDLGGGTGLVSEKLLVEGYNVIRIDRSPEMLRVGFQKEKNKSIRTAHCITGDAFKLPLKPEIKFDLIVCGQLFNFFGHDVEKALGILKKHLKKGGSLIFDIDNRYGWAAVEVLKGFPDNALEIMKNGEDKRHGITNTPYHLFDHSEITSIVKDAGFKIDMFWGVGNFCILLNLYGHSPRWLDDASLNPVQKKYISSTFDWLLALEEELFETQRYRLSAHWLIYRLKN